MGKREILYEKTPMKEYTILSIIGVFAAILADLFIFKTKLFFKKNFWIFWGIMFVLIFIINGYLTWRPVVIYGEQYFMNIRLFTIPFEDFLFGFSLLTLNICIWEFYTNKWVKK